MQERLEQLKKLWKKEQRNTVKKTKRPLLRGMKDAHALAKNKPHGTRIKYLGGCRCLPCCAANSRYSVERDRKKRLGLGNPLVPVRLAKAHFKKMSHAGVGYKTLARAAHVACSVAAKIVNGKRKQIRKETEQRILAAKPEPVGKSLVDAAPTWRLINRLLSEGFTKTALAQRLGFKKALQLNKNRITAANAKKVRQFYVMIMAI